MGGLPVGFFFINQELGKKPSKQQRSIAALNNIGCAACTLNKIKVNSPKMQPTLADETLVYFLGESPGKIEDDQGKPFVGPSGKLLRYCIPNDMIEYCSFDNVISCRPSLDNRDPTLSEIECCRKRHVEYIEKAKPKIIVGLGAHAQQWMLNSTDQQGLRGRVFAVKVGSHKCWFMPTYHPARVLHSASEQAKNNGRSRQSNDESYLVTTYFGRTFKLDIEKALTYVNALPPEIEEESELRKKVTTVNDFNTVCDLLKKAKQAKVKAVDIETNALRPYSTNAAILTIALSFDTIHFAFSLDHRLAKWSSVERHKILELVKCLLNDSTIKIAHNAVFECEWFAWLFGKEVINHAAWECTQLMAHFLDERRGAGQSADEDTKRATYQSLDFLIRLHFGLSYKACFNVDRKNIAHADHTETLLYNATDTRLTLKLWHRQNELLRTEGLYNAYQRALPRQPTVALMQHLGMSVNQTTVKRLQKKLEEEIAVIEAEIDELDVIKQYKNDHKNKEFNPLGDDGLAIFRDYLKCPEIKIQDGNKVRLSIDKRILEKIDHPFAKLLVKLRNRGKMKSTYVDGLESPNGKYIYSDGNIHCNFNTTFTETGRTSSDLLNMQNFPKRNDAWIREEIEAPEGYAIVAADYGQLEACAAAMISRDKTYIKYLWEDFDTHMAWAVKIAKKIGKDISDPKAAKSFRSEVKGGFVFASFYGASAKKVASSIGIEEDLAEEFQEELWETFAGYRSWQLKTLKFYRDNGFVEDPTGRRRHHPLTSNELLNAPIQGFASEIVVDAMNRLSYIASTTNKWHLHPRLNIHDDLTTILPLKGIDRSIEIISKTMLTPTVLNLIPQSFRVPLSVTVSLGKDWFHMEELGKFWSHRDV